MKRSAGQTLRSQLAVGPSAIQGPGPGSSRAARSWSAAAIQATGSGGGSSPSSAPSCCTRCPGWRPPRATTRRPARTVQAKAEARRSTTRSQRCPATWRHSVSQCRRRRRFSSTTVQARFGMRAKTPSAAGPQATTTFACGWVRIRWSSSPVDSTASPIRVAVMKRMRTPRP